MLKKAFYLCAWTLVFGGYLPLAIFRDPIDIYIKFRLFGL